MKQNQQFRERCVYGIFSDTGILKYVGQCFLEGLRQRWWRHRRPCEVKVNYPKWKWLRENPGATCKIIQRDLWSKQESDQIEIQAIAACKPGQLLNLTKGGDINPMLHPDLEKRKAAIEKVRQAALKRRHSEKTKDKIRQHVTGKPGFWRNKKIPPEICERISQSLTGKTHSPQTRMKMSKSQKKTWLLRRKSAT